ncbi:MAG: ATP-binding protein [Chitinophagaceae bacterium]
MKYFFILLLVIPFTSPVCGQVHEADSLIKLLQKIPEDTNRVNLLLKIASKLFFYKPDISFEYSTKAAALSDRLGYTKGNLTALTLGGESLRLTGDYPGSLKLQFEALEINRKLKDADGEASNLGNIGAIYLDLREYREAVHYLLQSNAIRQNLPNSPDGIFILTTTGIVYDFLKMPDSAFYYLQMANIQNEEIRHPQLKSFISMNIGLIYFHIGKTDSALHYYNIALLNSIASNESINLSRVYQRMAEVHQSLANYDSAMYYARIAFTEAQRTSQKLFLLESSSFLSGLYRMRHNLDSAFFYEDITVALKDSLYGTEKLKKMQLLMLSEQKRQQQILQEQELYKNRMKLIALLAAAGVFLIIVFILYRNNRQKQKKNKVLEATLTNLKSTQTQLIQSEKMASLGELTAGIAHEIQNPLNFVNNFSDVNREMIAEMKEEITKGNYAEVKIIADDIEANEQKINHHGKRADAIVKGMLQHSRSSSGVREPTDINALCDEYLRLSYHGLRAKDKSFNATIKTDFDASLEKINVIPQDIGRVILNLLTNAFYAVTEKKKQQPEGYEPTVSVSTKKIKEKVEIKVSDNGNGIPQKVLDKIFQPFFTTKPTGQGTGLGLSLSYDIVTKGHGGELKVETKEGGGTTFIIKLPA